MLASSCGKPVVILTLKDIIGISLFAIIVVGVLIGLLIVWISNKQEQRKKRKFIKDVGKAIDPVINPKPEYKTSREWYKTIPEKYNVKILDPDGWNRTNYEFSFNEQLITKEEFKKRLSLSTIQCNHGFFTSDW